MLSGLCAEVRGNPEVFHLLLSVCMLNNTSIPACRHFNIVLAIEKRSVTKMEMRGVRVETLAATRFFIVYCYAVNQE